MTFDKKRICLTNCFDPEAVYSLIKRREKNAKRPFMFPSKGNPDRPIGAVRKEHDATVKRSGIKDHFRLYDLRHTFATRAVAAGLTSQRSKAFATGFE